MPAPQRVALIGFMGSGKSTVGRLLASRLGYAFLDLDALIEKRSGKSIRAIFEEEGEEAFRRLEAAALRELTARRKLVVAAGGGVPMREENRPFFSESATFYLEISFTEFLRRTEGNPVRPLRKLAPTELKELYERRLPVYRALGRAISTEGRSPQESVEEILDLLRAGSKGPPPGRSPE